MDSSGVSKKRKRVASYEELSVYKSALELQQAIFHVTQSWPTHEKYALTDQIRRSSRSIGSNIAESWAKRRYEAHFVSKLTDADGEQHETRHWLRTARLCGYLTDMQFSEFEDCCKKIGAMLGKMIADAKRWTISK